ncbi:MAG: toxin co-regulated pilus biosynthesis Q family protein [Alphaproteobacteria bacterium]|nr:toxin co-regulated pilus biosynthesis Q family protein [Alphaproteobacteria bacterium]
MARMKIKNGAAAALLPVLLMTGAAAMLAEPSPVFAGFEMKSYAPLPAAAPQAPAAETSKPAPATVIPPAAAAAEGDVLPGFGSGLPLAIALQQVAPAGYQFSFAAGVNPGAPVSWAGGKPWKQVLADMLSPQQLDFNIQNSVIVIDHLTAAKKPAAPAVTLAAIEQQLASAPAADVEAAVSDEGFFDETEKMEPIVTRRNSRRASISTRRDFAVAGHSTWLERFKGRFKKHEEAKAEKAKAEKAKAAQQKEIAAQKDIQWDNGPGPAQKAAPVESVALGAPQGDIQWQPDAPTALSPVSVPTADGGIVSGFGSGMPLAIALQQVVPSGYDLSFSPGIDKNIAVSWEGGKPWKQVLNDMLAAQQLNFRLEDKVITIDRLAGKTQAIPVAEEKMLPPLSLTKPIAAATPVAGQPVSVEKTEGKEKTAAAPVDSIVSRRNSIAGRSGPDADRRSWLERFRDRFGFKKGEQNKEALPVKAAEESVATDKVTEEKVAETKISSRRAKPAEMPPAMEVAPPPAAVPLAAAVKSAAAVVAEKAPPKPVWLAPKDKTLKDVLSDWSKTAGVELYWSTDYDYRLNSNIAYSGSFDEAVGELLGGFADIRPQPYGQLHQVLDGSKILVVNTY